METLKKENSMPSKKIKKESNSKATPKPIARGAFKKELLPPQVLPTHDDQEEMDEQAESAAHAATGEGSGNAAALAAAVGTSEMSASFKNFRHHPDMENFYRFIHENDLRQEALVIIDEIILQKQQRKLLKMAKTQAH
jgi:hypothetical protein